MSVTGTSSFHDILRWSIAYCVRCHIGVFVYLPSGDPPHSTNNSHPAWWLFTSIKDVVLIRCVFDAFVLNNMTESDWYFYLHPHFGSKRSHFKLALPDPCSQNGLLSGWPEHFWQIKKKNPSMSQYVNMYTNNTKLQRLHLRDSFWDASVSVSRCATRPM